MEISESEVREWYESNGIADDDWESLEGFTREMLAVEALADSWESVTKLLEAGMPESAVIVYFDAESIGVGSVEVLHRAEEDSFESLTSYVFQNTTSEEVKELFTCSEVTVESVSAMKGRDGRVSVTIECEGTAEIFK